MTLDFRVMSSRFKHSLNLLKLFVAVMRFYLQSFIAKQSLKRYTLLKIMGV